MILFGDWVNAHFSLLGRSIVVDFGRAELNGPGVYQIELPVLLDRHRIFPSQIRLLDTDQDKFSFTPRAESLVAGGQGLFTIQKKRNLLVAWPIPPTGLAVKGKGVLKLPLLFPSWIVDVAFFLLSGSCAVLFYCQPFRLGHQSPGPAGHRCGRMVPADARKAFFRRPQRTFSLFVVGLSPIVERRGRAGSAHLAGRRNEHFPFSRVILLQRSADFLARRFFVHRRAPNLLALQRPTLQGIYTLVVFQHLALVLSLGLLCKTITRREGLRGGFVLGCCFPRVCTLTFSCVVRRHGLSVRRSFFSRSDFASMLCKVTKPLTGLVTVFPWSSRSVRDISICFLASG